MKPFSAGQLLDTVELILFSLHFFIFPLNGIQMQKQAKIQ